MSFEMMKMAQEILNEQDLNPWSGPYNAERASKYGQLYDAYFKLGTIDGYSRAKETLDAQCYCLWQIGADKTECLSKYHELYDSFVTFGNMEAYEQAETALMALYEQLPPYSETRRQSVSRYGELYEKYMGLGTLDGYEHAMGALTMQSDSIREEDKEPYFANFDRIVSECAALGSEQSEKLIADVQACKTWAQEVIGLRGENGNMQPSVSSKGVYTSFIDNQNGGSHGASSNSGSNNNPNTPAVLKYQG